MSILKVSGLSKNYYMDSEYEIIEVESAEKEFILPDGSILKNPYINFEGGKAKTYIISKQVESVNKKDKIISVDFVYGNIDFVRLTNDVKYKERFFKYIVSREGLDNIVKKACGALPKDVRVPDSPENSEWFKDLKYYEFDAEITQAVIGGVLRKSYREKQKVEPVSESRPSQIPKGFWNAFEAIEGRRTPKKKKKSILEICQEIDAKNAEINRKRKEERDRRIRRARGEVVEESINYAKEIDWNEVKPEDSLVIFFKTGAVVIQRPKYNEDGTRDGTYETVVVSRYSLGYKEIGSETPVEIQTILMSDIDDEKLALEGEYRDKFISDICLPILQYAKYGRPEEIRNTWPYIGAFAFTPDDSIPLRKVAISGNEDLQKYFSILSGTKKKKEPENR